MVQDQPITGYTDNLVKVTKYRTGLDPKINQAITTSGNPPSLTDYAEWRVRAFRQYNAEIAAKASRGHAAPPPRAPPIAQRPRAPVLPAVAPAVAARPAPAPVAHPVPMEVNRARLCGDVRRTCFRCGSPGHLAPGK
ncbi:unnamed protein product [Mycena citricolor]|uniref:CCHC-type domain-containing protein n=1 Tax=Mycena citricolor TaxID=2018698 RepID=A0AAD2GUS2_9AGAR|nr:unnamed protein product [Mycena citricolor]